MSRKTESESLFELFCDQYGIRWEAIPTLAKEQKETPDYYIYIGQQKIVCEIKQIDPNQEEIEQQRIFEAGGLAVSGSTPGDRVRTKIAAGASQIRVRAKGRHPSILVLYNNVLIADHTNSYFILVAMYGLETHVLAVPEDLNSSPYLTDKKFGPKRKMSNQPNTSVSAVAVIRPISKESQHYASTTTYMRRFRFRLNYFGGPT